MACVAGGISAPLLYLLSNDDMTLSPLLAGNPFALFLFFWIPIIGSAVFPFILLAVFIVANEKKDDATNQQSKIDDHDNVIKRIERTRFHVSLTFVGIHATCLLLLGYLFAYASVLGNVYLLVLLLVLVCVTSVAIAYVAAWIMFGSTASMLQQQLEQLGPRDDNHDKLKQDGYEDFLFLSFYCITVYGPNLALVTDAFMDAEGYIFVMLLCMLVIPFAMVYVGYRAHSGLPLFQLSQQQSSKSDLASSSTIKPKSSLSLTERNEVNEDTLFEF